MWKNLSVQCTYNNHSLLFLSSNVILYVIYIVKFIQYKDMKRNTNFMLFTLTFYTPKDKIRVTRIKFTFNPMSFLLF